jgi:endonuclease/exonuclease/phosphatase (EEP) superfamily protein YafD
VGEQRELGRVPVVLGDLNASPWSTDFRLLLDAGLLDSERGFGPQGTFPAGWAVQLPIDHCLHDPALVTTAREVGADLGSDHRPLLVELALGED